MVEKEFEATPIYIVPIFASLLVSVLCAFLILESKIELMSVTVLPETGLGPLFNATLFVSATGFGATVIYILLKRGVYRFIRFLMGVVFSVLTFILSIFYFELAFMAICVESSLVATLFFAFLATTLVVLEVFVKKGRFFGVIVLGIGGATGTLLGASVPTFSAVLILLLLAVYDVIAVFYGPVGKIVSKGLEHLPGASFSFRKIHVGLGDLTFYSMLVSNMLLSFGWKACIAAICGVLLGSFLSFKMVEKKGMFPGLPFSVVLGLLAGFIFGVGFNV